MAKTFHLTIARVGENIFDGQAQSVMLPGVDGVFTVYANHEAFVSPLKPGEAKIVAENGDQKTIQIPETGIVEVSSNQTTVIL